MTESEQIAMLEQLTDETDEDVLSAYLFLAKGKILTRLYPYGDSDIIPAKYDGLVIEIAVFLLNKRGAEGESSHTENGVTRSYGSSDVPLSMLRQVTPMVGVLTDETNEA